MLRHARLLVMFSLLIPGLLTAGPLLAAAPAPQVVELRERPGTAPDAAARQLAAQDLAEAQRKDDSPLVLTGSAVLGRASDPPALFVQLQSPRECGSAGCETAVYVRDGAGWRRVLDAVSGPIAVDPAMHKSMHDLLAGRTRYVWTGTAYADTKPAPAVNLRRRR